MLLPLYTGHYEDKFFYLELRELKELFEGEFFGEEEVPFLSSLFLSFSDSKEKYTALLKHFRVFKEAYVFSILDEIIENGELYPLTFDVMEEKLFGQAFYEGSKARQDYFHMVLTVIEGMKEDSIFKNEDYEDYLIRAFFISAVKGNPLVLSASDFTPQHVILYSKLLKEVLRKHKQRLIDCYERIINTEE